MPPIMNTRKVQKDKLSRKVVPWMSKAEWEEVGMKLYSLDKEERSWALSRVAVWKSRCYPKLPLGVEVTAGFIRTKVLEDSLSQHPDPCSMIECLSMQYAMALICFVNLITDLRNRNGNNTVPISIAAMQLKIPEWIIDLRHEGSHIALPSITILREATHYCLVWLKKYYWAEELARMDDVVQETVPLKMLNNKELRQVVAKFSSQEGDMVALVKHVGQFFKHNKERVSILLEDNLMIPGAKNCDSDTNQEKKFSVMVSKWLPMLNEIASTGSLTCLLKHMLSRMTYETSHSNLWLLKWLTRIVKEASGDKTYKCKIFTSHPEINWDCLLHVAMKHPSEETLKILPLILKMQSCVPPNKQKLLLQLMTVFCGKTEDDTDNNTVTKRKLYTVDDLKAVAAKKTAMGNSSWVLCDDIDWTRYPIGLLPGQVGCKILNFDLPEHVNELQHHAFETLPSTTVNTDPIFEESDGNIGSMVEPDLETRLLIAKHSINF